MPNTLALAMLALWPMIALILFRRLPVGRAIIASLLVAYMFLPPQPAGFDFPLLPALTKETIPSLVALLICIVLYRPGMALIPASPVARGLMLVFVLSPLATVLTNREPLFFGEFALPGLRLREAVGMMVGQVILLAPFLLARAWLSQPEDQRDLLWALLIGGLVYAPLMLIEVRLSPQLNIWTYGYFQHVFSQMIRGDGFRPIVFMQHGLWVAFFAMTAVAAAAALWRVEPVARKGALAAAGAFLFAVLILCKSLAALLYAIVLVPLFLLVGARTQIRIAMVLAIIALAYPLAKGAHLVPDDQMLAVAERISPERAHSLAFRFGNEAQLLDRAVEKPLFGWGLWGRNHIHNPDNGQIMTVTDGRWILVIGILGWVGFLAEFGLLTLPIFLMWARSRGGGQALPPYIGPLILILAVNIIDLIPNATITPLTWLWAGALMGYAERHKMAPKPRPAPIKVIL
jgi:hypothetical protein